MRPQKQKFRHRPAEGLYGDCHRTAIAVCLGLDRDDVPHFMEHGPATEPKREIQAWLAVRGLVGIDLIFPRETALDDILSSLAHLNPGVPFILGGQSKNGTNHSVVCLDGEIVCDPALDDSGIVGPMDDGYWWVTYFGAALTAVSQSRAPDQSERVRELEAEVGALKQKYVGCFTHDQYHAGCDAIRNERRLWEDRAEKAEAALAEAKKVIGAAQGHLLNALIDLQTSTPKKTTIGTIEGGIKITRDWRNRNPESSNGK